MTLTPTLSRRRGSQNPVPLLPEEKGLGDEGLQFNFAYPLSAHAAQLMNALQAQEKGDLDFISVLTLYEMLAGIEEESK